MITKSFYPQDLTDREFHDVINFIRSKGYKPARLLISEKDYDTLVRRNLPQQEQWERGELIKLKEYLELEVYIGGDNRPRIEADIPDSIN